MCLVAASKAVNPNQWNGKIVVKSKNGQYKVSIPYQASVLHGYGSLLCYIDNKPVGWGVTIPSL